MNLDRFELVRSIENEIIIGRQTEQRDILPLVEFIPNLQIETVFGQAAGA